MVNFYYLVNQVDKTKQIVGELTVSIWPPYITQCLTIDFNFFYAAYALMTSKVVKSDGKLAIRKSDSTIDEGLVSFKVRYLFRQHGIRVFTLVNLD